MAYKKVSKNYIKNQYIKVFQDETGCENLTEEEDEFLSRFTDIEEVSQAKIIFFGAVLRFARFYPKFMIRFLARIELKKAFEIEKAPISFKKITNNLADIIFYQAMFYFCRKIDNFERVGIVSASAEKSYFKKLQIKVFKLFRL